MVSPLTFATVIVVIVGCLIAGVINGIRAIVQTRRRNLAYEAELEAEWPAPRRDG